MRKTSWNRSFVRYGRHGRLMRDDNNGAGGGGTPPAGDNNSGGNSGDSGNAGGDSNNSGQDFDPSTFWTSSDQGGNSAPNGESAGGNNSDSNTQGGGGNLQETLTNQLNSMAFGELMTPDIAQQINNGDFTGIQKSFEGAMQQAVRHALSLNVQIMRPLSEQIMAQVREEFGSTLNQRDNNDALVKDFPTAANPQVRPIIQGIFDQALKNTKGDRALAVKQTKEMIRLTANLSAGDLDLSVAPRGPEDSGAPKLPSNFSWLDELTGR